MRQGAAEVREGLAFCLSLPLDLPGGNVLNPRRHPPVVRPTLRNGRPNMNYRLATDNLLHTDVVCDDLVVMHLQYSTQWDSLAHVGQLFDADGDGLPEPLYYNGYRAGEDVLGPDDAADAGVPAPGASGSTSNARALGIENMAERCVQGRGGDDRPARPLRRRAPRRRPRRPDARDAGRRRRGRAGRHGAACTPASPRCCWRMNGRPDADRLDRTGAVLDGRDERLLQWITDSGLAVLIADNYAVEAHPASQRGGCCATLPLHEHCLFKLGIHLGELWHLTPLARWLRAHGRSRFLLTAPPLRLPGAVGSPATPVGTV